MYTLNNSVASKLPQTSNIKFIDIWIIYGLVLHFVVLLLLVLIEHLPIKENVVFVEHSKAGEHSEPNLSAQEATKLFARNVLPIFEIIFTILIQFVLSSYIIYNCLHWSWKKFKMSECGFLSGKK
jgi:hypothetical protein